MLSCVSASGDIFRFTFPLLSEVSYSDPLMSVGRQKSFSVFLKMPPLCFAVVKFYCTDRLFTAYNVISDFHMSHDHYEILPLIG